MNSIQTPEKLPIAYIGCDLEMSGTDISCHGMLQVAAWATGENEDYFKGYFVSDVNPFLVGYKHVRKEIEINPSSMKVNGFKLPRIEAAPPIYDALFNFNTFIKRFTSHNRIVFTGMKILGDLQWLQKDFRKNGLEGKHFASYIELEDMVSVIFGKPMGLAKTAARLGIHNGDAHDALGDAYISVKVFHRLKDMLIKDGKWDEEHFLKSAI